MNVISMEPVIDRVILIAMIYPLCVALGWYIIRSIRILFRGRGG